jgi:hypothetical protein
VPDLAGDHRNHGLIEQGQTFTQPAQLQQSPEMHPERKQVSVTEAAADLGCPSGSCLGLRIVTLDRCLDNARKQEEAPLGTLVWLLGQHPTSFGEPPTGHSQISLEKQRERHPEQAPGGTPDIISCDVGTMGALQGLPAFVRMAEQMGRRCQQLEICTPQRARLVGQRKRRVGLAPREPMASLTPSGERAISLHRSARLRSGAG